MKKWITGILMLSMLLSITACKNAKQDIKKPAQTGNTVSSAAQPQAAAEKKQEPTKSTPQALKQEYQLLVDEIKSAREKGYHYYQEINVMRAGNLLQVFTGGNINVITIGEIGNRFYHVVIVNGEIANSEDITDDADAMDFAADHLDRLMLIFEADSKGINFNDGHHAWVIKKMEILKDTTAEGLPATVIHVETQMEGRPDQAHSIDIFTVSGGLLEAYSFSTPYFRDGAMNHQAFHYKSRGPIVPEEFELFFELVKGN